MSNRRVQFGSGEYYHVYNRGVDKRTIFEDSQDIQRFFESMLGFNTSEPIGSLYERSFKELGGPTPKSEEESLVEIVAYCLNPNHFHFILRQVSDSGVSEFMKRLGAGYTGYFNNKYERSGALFQGKFKAKHIDNNEYLLHLSAYVNLNDRVHQLGGPTPKLVRSLSSWREYTEGVLEEVCNKDAILEEFGTRAAYKDFALSALQSILEKREDSEPVRALLLE